MSTFWVLKWSFQIIYHVRFLQKTPPSWLAKAIVNTAFYWLSRYLSSNHLSGVFCRILTVSYIKAAFDKSESIFPNEHEIHSNSLTSLWDKIDCNFVASHRAYQFISWGIRIYMLHKFVRLSIPIVLMILSWWSCLAELTWYWTCLSLLISSILLICIGSITEWYRSTIINGKALLCVWIWCLQLLITSISQLC